VSIQQSSNTLGGGALAVSGWHVAQGTEHRAYNTTPGGPDSQEPRARRSSLIDPLGGCAGGWGRQMRGRSCYVAHESKHLPCAGTRQRAGADQGWWVAAVTNKQCERKLD
jgi:hypothetical protein